MQAEEGAADEERMETTRKLVNKVNIHQIMVEATAPYQVADACSFDLRAGLQNSVGADVHMWDVV